MTSSFLPSHQAPEKNRFLLLLLANIVAISQKVKSNCSAL